MFHRKTPWFFPLVVCTALAMGAALVYACGPGFPLQLLDDRKGTLLGAPANSFEWEVGRLVPPDARIKAAMPVRSAGDPQTEEDDDQSGSNDPRRVPQALTTGLSVQQQQTLTTVAHAADGDAAYARGTRLPRSLRLYAAALVDLAHANPSCDDEVRAVWQHPAPPPAKAGESPSQRTARETAERLALALSACRATASQPAAERLRVRAATRLRRILALPPSKRAPLAASAAWQLAQIATTRATACDGAASCGQRIATARAALARVRRIVARGAPDPQGYAAASLGDTALLELRAQISRPHKRGQRPARQWQQCNWLSFAGATPCAAAIPTANLKRAIHLYARQAALMRSNSGQDSLTWIAQWALADARRATRLIDDGVVQRLLVTYALARVSDVVKAKSTDAALDSDGSGDDGDSDWALFFDLADASRGHARVTPNPQLVALVEAIAARGIAHVQDADKLASLAYREGRYDLAARLVRDAHGALAEWVRAKLALRQGDMEGAAHAYAAALKAFPIADDTLEPMQMTLLKGEQGVLSLARGQYVEALDILYQAASVANDMQSSQWSPRADGTAFKPLPLSDPGPPMNSGGTLQYRTWANIGYGNDMAYVAERVVTVEELKAFVDAHVPATPAPPLPAFDPKTPAVPIPPVGDTLRYLLARRLVRAGRVSDALPYFPVDNDPRFAQIVDSDKPDQYAVKLLPLRQWARAYGDALDHAQHGWEKTTRAQAWFDAALLAKNQGMELMGYEQDPDFEDVNGLYDGGSGRVKMWDRRSCEDRQCPDTPTARADQDLAGPYVTADEKHRYAASESQPYTRFHYRTIAADHAQRAADLLPSRSQAYAAVLCQATRWTHLDDPDRAWDFYQQWVEQGAYVDFGSDLFGTRCTAPDFRAARFFHVTQTIRAVKDGLHRPRMLAAGALCLAAIMGVAGLVFWRRQRRKHATPT